MSDITEKIDDLAYEKQMMESDIVIIGAGIAGCIAAMALSEHYHVILIDKAAEPKPRIGECLAPAARRILRQLRLEDIIDRPGIHLTSLGTRSYWSSDQLQVVDHLRNPDGNGWFLNRPIFESDLRRIAQERGVRCIWPAQYYSSTYDGTHWKIVAKSAIKDPNAIQYDITTRFIIDASGRQAHFARAQDIKRIQLDKLISCWATLPHSSPHQMSTISASENGWWYASPLPDDQLLISLQTDSDLIRPNLHKDLPIFLNRLTSNPEMHKLINDHEETLKLQGTVAANSSRLENVCGHQWAALGDAALSFDPLSSQGMFNAMANAMQLTQLISEFKLIEHTNHRYQDQFQLAYTNQINAVWGHYLHHKKNYYSQEMRWGDAVFWRRRAG